MKMNIYTSQLLRRTFVRQLSENDCGQACVAMLLRYAGEVEKAADLLVTVFTENQSLLSLRNIIASYGYKSQCVTMTMEFLKEMSAPCILHTEDVYGNMHYQVCYGSIRTLEGHGFLMADPAKQFYFIKAPDLDKIWQSKAALFVHGLTEDLSPFSHSSFSLVVRAAQIPAIVWIIMPALTLINALFGIALSFLLQRGFFSTYLFSSRHIIIALVILLWIISVFKSTFTYLRQIILLKLNNRIRRHFFKMLTEKLTDLKQGTGAVAGEWPSRAFRQISLMQNALSVFITTLISEGSLLIIAVCAVGYMLPIAGTLLASFLLIQLASAVISDSSYVYKNSAIRQNSARVERSLSDMLLYQQITIENITAIEADHLAAAEHQAVRLSRKGIFHEVGGAFIVVVILAITSFRLSALQISYPTLMFVVILSYIAVSATPRLYSSYLTVAEGADAFLQFTLRTAH